MTIYHAGKENGQGGQGQKGPGKLAKGKANLSNLLLKKGAAAKANINNRRESQPSLLAIPKKE